MYIINHSKRVGKLSSETHFAIIHMTETLLKLCDYLLNTFSFEYVMLGIFETDDLEERLINIEEKVQVVKSERKLKVTKNY